MLGCISLCDKGSEGMDQLPSVVAICERFSPSPATDEVINMVNQGEPSVCRITPQCPKVRF